MEHNSLNTFHLLYCELIEECLKNHGEANFMGALKDIGRNIGMKIYPHVSKTVQHQRFPNYMTLFKAIQSKIWRQLWGNDASQCWQATSEASGDQKEQYYFVLQDDNCSLFTWMPNEKWILAFTSGVLEGILLCNGLKSDVRAELEKGEKKIVQYVAIVDEIDYERWTSYR